MVMSRSFVFFNKLNNKLNKNKMEKIVQETPTLTFGQKAVGISFNPSNDSRVDRIKQLSANLIDEIHGLRSETSSAEVKRMSSLAISEIQTGQMWGVKAATWKD